MTRGEIWLADLGGRAGRRPVVILTRDSVIPHLHKVTIAEVTTKGAGYETELDIDHRANLPQYSFVRLDALQTVPKTLLQRFIGKLDPELMKEVSRKAVRALGLEEAFSESQPQGRTQ